MVVALVVAFARVLLGELDAIAFDAIQDRDYPVIQAFVLVTATFLVFINLLVDLSYAWLDPRIRYS